MSPEQWQKIHELFETALERPIEERAAFLAQACTGDEEMQRRVEAMLAADARNDLLIDRPAYQAVDTFPSSLPGSLFESLANRFSVSVRSPFPNPQSIRLTERIASRNSTRSAGCSSVPNSRRSKSSPRRFSLDSQARKSLPTNCRKQSRFAEAETISSDAHSALQSTLH